MDVHMMILKQFKTYYSISTENSQCTDVFNLTLDISSMCHTLCTLELGKEQFCACFLK